MPRAAKRASKRKEHPLSMRLPAADIAMIDRAADLRGRSRTDFVREAAVRAAEEVLMENTLIRMTPSGFNAFVAALTAPPSTVPEIVELMQRVPPWEGKGSRKT
jgi:uncharacterized protein (DUF1778 family)